MYFYCCLMVLLDQEIAKIQARRENWLFPSVGKGIEYRGAAHNKNMRAKRGHEQEEWVRKEAVG